MSSNDRCVALSYVRYFLGKLGSLLQELITINRRPGQSPVINGPFSGNVNSNNFVVGGDAGAWSRVMSDMMKGVRFHLCILVPINLGVDTDLLIGYADNGGPPRGAQNRPAERRTRTQPDVSIPPQWGGVNNFASSSRFSSGGPIFAGRCPRLLKDSANLTSHRPADRTPGRN